MGRLLAGRILQGLAVVWVVATLTFALIHLAPGDPFSYPQGRRIDPEIRAHWRHVYCLDRPLAAQYVCYVRSIASGDLGYSVAEQRPVRDILIDYVPRTLELMFLGLTASFLIGIVLGVLQARHRGTFVDWGSRGIALLFYSMPDFWLALMLALLFAYWIPLFPISGIEDVIAAPTNVWWQQAADHLRHLVLPVATLALIELGRAPTSCTREGCGPFRGANFGIGLTISSIAIHVVTLVATVTLAIINAVRVGEAKKKIDVAFDGVALHF